MKIAFVCSPYRSENHFQVKQNIARAERVAAWLWKNGIAALCPQMNTAFMSGITREDVFLEGIMQMMLRCDMVVTTVRLGVSSGCDDELLLAMKKSMKVYRFDEEKETLIPYLATAWPEQHPYSLQLRSGETCGTILSGRAKIAYGLNKRPGEVEK